MAVSPDDSNFWASTGANFITTHWTMVLSAIGQGNAEASQQALNTLCKGYWPPVYAYLRRTGHSVHDAQDLTQGFFTYVCEHETLRKVDSNKGKFRSYLLGALKFYVSNQRQREQAAIRGGKAVHLSIDVSAMETAIADQLVTSTTPEHLFDRHWARTLLGNVEHQLQKNFESRHRGAEFEILKEFLGGKDSDVRYVDASAKLGKTESAVRMAVSRLRKQFGQILRENVAETVASDADVNQEIRELLAVFQIK